MRHAPAALVLFALAVSSGCQSSPAPPLTGDPPSAVPLSPPPPTSVRSVEEPQAGCPSPETGTLLLSKPEDGYCLVYPDEYDLVDVEEHSSFVPPVLGEVCIVRKPASWTCANALAIMEVETASGLTAGQVADALLAMYPGSTVQRTTAMIANEEAVILDGIQGVQKQLKVFLVHAGRLYKLTIALGRQEGDEDSVRADALYTLLVNSLVFLPVD